MRVFKADWKRLGQEAVFALNREMLKEEIPNAVIASPVIASPDGDVTEDIADLLTQAGATANQARVSNPSGEDE